MSGAVLRRARAGAEWVHLTSAGRKDRKGMSIFSHCVVRSRCSASAERAGQKMLGWYSNTRRCRAHASPTAPFCSGPHTTSTVLCFRDSEGKGKALVTATALACPHSSTSCCLPKQYSSSSSRSRAAASEALQAEVGNMLRGVDREQRLEDGCPDPPEDPHLVTQEAVQWP